MSLGPNQYRRNGQIFTKTSVGDALEYVPTGIKWVDDINSELAQLFLDKKLTMSLQLKYFEKSQSTVLNTVKTSGTNVGQQVGGDIGNIPSMIRGYGLAGSKTMYSMDELEAAGQYVVDMAREMRAQE